MAFPVKIVPRAAREIAEAWDWWQVGSCGECFFSLWALP